jgi:hypothetical protein
MVLTGGWDVRPRNSPPSVNRPSRKCGILDVSTAYYRDSFTFYTLHWGMPKVQI